MSSRAIPALSVLVVLLSALAAGAQAPPRAEMPSYAPGEKWIRSDGLYEMVRVDDGTYVFAAPGREFHNRDGVSLQELYEYIEQQVTAKSRAVGGNQHPVMKGEMEGVLPLAKVRPK